MGITSTPAIRAAWAYVGVAALIMGAHLAGMTWTGRIMWPVAWLTVAWGVVGIPLLYWRVREWQKAAPDEN
jgi:hypothetical protein